MNKYSEYFPTKKKTKKLETKKPLNSLSDLVSELRLIEKKEKKKKTSSIHINKVVKSAASFYEKMRNTIDFKEEHLLRRGAVQRIITRRLGFGQSSKVVSKSLIYELVQSGYIKNDSVEKKSIKKISVILEKYLTIVEKLDKKRARVLSSYCFCRDRRRTHISRKGRVSRNCDAKKYC